MRQSGSKATDLNWERSTTYTTWPAVSIVYLCLPVYLVGFIHPSSTRPSNKTSLLNLCIPLQISAVSWYILILSCLLVSSVIVSFGPSTYHTISMSSHLCPAFLSLNFYTEHYRTIPYNPYKYQTLHARQKLTYKCKAKPGKKPWVLWDIIRLCKTGSVWQLDAEILKHRCCNGIVFGDVGQISRPTRVGTLRRGRVWPPWVTVVSEAATSHNDPPATVSLGFSWTFLDITWYNTVMWLWGYKGLPRESQRKPLNHREEIARKLLATTKFTSLWRKLRIAAGDSESWRMCEKWKLQKATNVWNDHVLSICCACVLSIKYQVAQIFIYIYISLAIKYQKHKKHDEYMMILRLTIRPAMLPPTHPTAAGSLSRSTPGSAPSMSLPSLLSLPSLRCRAPGRQPPVGSETPAS